MSATQFETVSEARKHFSDLINVAESGGTGVVRRNLHRAAVVDADRLRDALARLLPGSDVVPEAGGWTVLLPGVPIAADGSTFDEALAEMVDALRDYAEDWRARLRHASNHADNWALVQLIELSSDEQLLEWLQQ